MKRFDKNDSGFSLVEMMVVLVIIGLMTSVVVLVLPSASSEKVARLTELRNALTAVSRDSVISGQVRGIRFNPRGYSVLTVREGKWEQVVDQRLGSWHSGELIAVSVEGADIDLTSDTGEVLRPHIWFLPTGERADFQIRFNFDGTPASIVTNPHGIEVQHES